MEKVQEETLGKDARALMYATTLMDRNKLPRNISLLREN